MATRSWGYYPSGGVGLVLLVLVVLVLSRPTLTISRSAVRMHVKNVALLWGHRRGGICVRDPANGRRGPLRFDRHNLPDLGPFTRFEFSTVGHIYDASDRPLIELAREQREISLRGHSTDRP